MRSFMRPIRLDDGSLGQNPVLTGVLKEAHRQVDVRKALYYPSPQGDPALIEEIRRVFVLPNRDIMVTSSATEALHSIFQSLAVDAGVAVQSPAYFGVWRQMKKIRNRVTAWETVSDLPHQLSDRQLIYLTSNFHPLTTSGLSDEDRKSVLKAADGKTIVEDNPNDLLDFSGQMPPRLQESHDDTLYVGTFSKILAPGLRLGFIAGQGQTLARIKSEKITTSLSNSALDQEMAIHALQQNYLDALRADFRSRWEQFRDVLSKYDLPLLHEVRGGIFATVRIPEHVELAELVRDCKAKGVTIEENRFHYADGKNRPLVRMNFVRNTEEDNANAVAAIADSISRQKK